MRMSWLREHEIAASGMIYEEDVESLREQGVRAVLSLSMRSPFRDGPPEDLAHMHIAVPDMTAPSTHAVVRGVEFLEAQREAGRPALVHCSAGYGRTGTLLACYLVARGLGPDQAMAEVRHARPGSIETLEQEQSVRDYAALRGGGDG